MLEIEVTILLKSSMFNLQEASVSLVGSGVFGMMKVNLNRRFNSDTF